ncbi:light-harvesting complex-like protein 3 isotype 1, chloroplastic [Physcomitrium patens]|uniref:Uncharacterized protein n=1 Tax=Physcomitrium patens TaxID=3218 RepID=A9RQ02_PHYPA|nr:light-harvesting complex-like protein 3 isotype 1, chloroplastic [Physcomitrium patens]PNR62795.1 hypothetical protein PHYPA_001219 [Physcomitrium patens]|eukprot:XP_024379271.1 light-harvesting complex-like protein 3 isotype 1, chloroplastic [Physcomitrella patens]
MVAMATVTKPLAGAAVVPVARSVTLSAQARKSSQLWVASRRCLRRFRAVVNVESRGARVVVRASADENFGSAADAGGNSIVLEVAALPEEPQTEGIGNVATTTSSSRKPSPLARGGTLDGAQAEGKAPAAATLGKVSPLVSSGKFEDPRWKNGTWDLSQFTTDGKTDWDAIIDAEVVRRKILEANPESSSNDDEVVFDTSIVPWWAWVKRFHLPEAELLNGRAAMIGYAAGWLVDAATGIGLVDQQNSFVGKILIFISVVGVLAIRKNSDVDNLRTLAQESTDYDKQWQATWKDAKDSGTSGGL